MKKRILVVWLVVFFLLVVRDFHVPTAGRGAVVYPRMGGNPGYAVRPRWFLYGGRAGFGPIL